jgi:hypothetical protein
MENYKAKIIDINGNETIRDFTDEEIAQSKASIAKFESEELAKAEKQALRDSANKKLAALGLTPEEIAAITGAN